MPKRKNFETLASTHLETQVVIGRTISVLTHKGLMYEREMILTKGNVWTRSAAETKMSSSACQETCNGHACTSWIDIRMGLLPTSTFLAELNDPVSECWRAAVVRLDGPASDPVHRQESTLLLVCIRTILAAAVSSGAVTLVLSTHELNEHWVTVAISDGQVVITRLEIYFSLCSSLSSCHVDLTKRREDLASIVIRVERERGGFAGLDDWPRRFAGESREEDRREFVLALVVKGECDFGAAG